MDKSEKRKQYLEIYRRQLRRELDAMGYGQSRDHMHTVERQDRPGLPAWLAVAAPVLATVGLADT